MLSVQLKLSRIALTTLIQHAQYHSIAHGLPSAAYTNPARRSELGVSESPGMTYEQWEVLDQSLRVDQAGEVAANFIYHGQNYILGKDPIAGPLIRNMWEQEKKHLQVMNILQEQHRVRPTLLIGIAKVAGFGLGATTALMGKEAAMACTEAVETVIGEHYDDQLRELDALPNDHPSISLLKQIVTEFRDDELEHLDTAIKNHSQHAPAHALLSSVIGVGCKVAIGICKRI